MKAEERQSIVVEESRFIPRLIVQEGELRVVRVEPRKIVMEEMVLDALGNASWRLRTTLVEPPALPDLMPDVPSLVHDLYKLFSSMEVQ